MFHRRTLGVLALLLTLLTCREGVWADDAAPPKKVALLVGVEEYLKPGFDSLNYCEDDAKAVGVELKKLGFEVTVLLGSAQDDTQRATKANIEAVTRRLVKPLGKKDVMLIMFSGHGQTLHPDSKVVPSLENLDQFTGYFCPYDAVLNDAESQVSLNFLLDDILKENVGRKLLVLDACRDIPQDRTPGSRNVRGIRCVAHRPARGPACTSRAASDSGRSRRRTWGMGSSRTACWTVCGAGRRGMGN